MPEKIEGPLGIWPWPVLNTIIQISGDGNEEMGFKEYNVNRDGEGRIQSVEIVQGGET